MWKQGYYVLLTSDNKILVDDAEEIKVKRVSEMKLINKIAYNDLVLRQEDTVLFISLKKKKNYNKYEDARQA